MHEKGGVGVCEVGGMIFFEKKRKKVWWVLKKVLPLHPQSREMPSGRLDSEGIQAEIAQLVEHDLAKVGVAGPSPVFRSTC